MKIINKEEFLKLPPNTLYHHYEKGGNFGELQIKLDSIESIDWYYSELYGWLKGCSNSIELFEKFEAIENGEDFQFDLKVGGRDGMYDEDQLFAVYDQEDLSELIQKLQSLTNPNIPQPSK